MGAVNLELVEGPTLPPGTCMFCATNPTEGGKPLPMVTAVGMDINWGETPYICWTCCGIIADLVDRPDRAKVEAVLRGAKLQKGHNKKLIDENEQMKRLMKGLMDGQDVFDEAKELLSDDG
jgi:hypothetical protein